MAEKQLVLIVDDDYDARTVVKTILSSAGYQVEEAADGKEALEKLKACQPELVILDIMMPGMSGYDVVVHMKQRPETQDLPIIMLTAKGDPDDLLKGYNEYSVDYYISKPFTTKQLLSGIKLVLD